MVTKRLAYLMRYDHPLYGTAWPALLVSQSPVLTGVVFLSALGRNGFIATCPA